MFIFATSPSDSLLGQDFRLGLTKELSMNGWQDRKTDEGNYVHTKDTKKEMGTRKTKKDNKLSKLRNLTQP